MSTGTMYQVRVLEESTYGTTPSAAAQEMNVDSFPLALDRQTSKPGVFTGDRRTHKMRPTREQAGLTVGGPFQYKNKLLFQEGLMLSDTETPVAISAATDISFNGTTGEVTSVSTDFSSAGIADGDLLYIASTTSNNGWKGPVTSLAANSFFLPSGQVTTESPAATDIDTERLTDANTAKSYSLEWEDTALTNRFLQSTGMFVTQVQYRFEQGGWIMETFTLGGKAPAPGSATLGTGGPTAAPTTDFMNGVQDWGTLYISEAATTLVVSTINVTIAQVMQPSFGLGSLGPSAVTPGNYTVTLEATVLYDDTSHALLSNIQDVDTLSLWWDVVDVQGNRFAMFFPAMAAIGDYPQPTDAGNLVDFTLRLDGHDPAKDSSSSYLSEGFGFQHAFFFKAA